MCSKRKSQQQLTSYGSNQFEKPKMTDRSLYNVLILSVSFFLIFTAFNTSSGIQKVVVDSINKQSNVGWNGYISLCIVYGVYSISNFLVPSILTLISTKTCLFLSTLGYFLYDLAFFYPIKYELTIVSIIVGLTAGSLWVAQGQFITDNSNSKNIDRNTGLFWAIYQGSLIFGNLYCYFQFEGIQEIAPNVRIQTYSVLSVVSLMGCIACLFIKKPESKLLIASESGEEIKKSEVFRTHPLTAFKRCFDLFCTKKMTFISIASFYTGLEQSFYGGVYTTVVGFTQAFGADSKKFIGFYGVFNGLGSIFGAIIFGWQSKRFIKDNRSWVFSFGFLGHIVAFALVFVNHPDQSTYAETTDFGYIEPRVWISSVVGFLLCFGDACFNTQLIALISTIYNDDSSQTSSAFALYKFFHCIGASLAFFYASFDMPLIVHLIILLVFGCLSSISFHMVEKFVKSERGEISLSSHVNSSSVATCY